MRVNSNRAEATVVASVDGRARGTRLALSIAMLLGANLLPMLGVVLWDWKLFDLIVIYWLETLIIGGFSILQMAFSAGWFALFLVPFFTVHFGGFMAGHFVFLNVLFGGKSGGRFSDIPARLHDMIQSQDLWIALVGLCISHGLGFLFYFLVPWWRGRRGRDDTTPPARQVEVGKVMFAPYRRVVIMHVTIIAGAALVMAFSNGIGFLALLIGLKTLSDLYLLRRDEKAAGAESATGQSSSPADRSRPRNAGRLGRSSSIP